MNDTVYIADPDQPFTCPYDGARTDFVDAVGDQYVERCLECKRVFYFEFDNDEEYSE
jgi:hypothetical protein